MPDRQPNAPVTRRLHIIAHAIVALHAAACATPTPDVGATCSPVALSTDGWQLFDEGDFTLRLPADFAAREARGIDSQVGAFRSGDGETELTYDYGLYSSDLAPDTTTLAESERCTAVIGGKPATIVVGTVRDDVDVAPAGGRHVVAAAWREVASSELGRVHLTIWATTHDSTRIPELRAVLQTVAFAKGTESGR